MRQSDAGSFEIKLANAEGVPVVRLGGNITRTAVRALQSVLATLARAGHYNIVLNVERIDPSSWDFLSQLAGTISEIRSHYGAVNLVASIDRFNQTNGADRLRSLFRICPSERDAICRIKRLSRPPEGIVNINARLLEQS